MLIYTVSVTFPDEQLRDEFVDWLQGGHIEEVIEAGALSGETIVVDGDDLVVNAVYRFADRGAYAAYNAGPAVALRGAGSQKFAERGAVFVRTTGISHGPIG